MNVSNPRPKIPRMHNQEANTLRMSEGKLSGLAATINKRNEKKKKNKQFLKSFLAVRKQKI